MKLRQALANDRKWIRDQPVFGVERKKQLDSQDSTMSYSTAVSVTPQKTPTAKKWEEQECYAESVILPYLNRNILRVKSITLDLNRSDN